MPYSRVGREFIEMFKQKAAQGVRVRLLLDAFGSWQFFLSPVRVALKRAGVEVVFFNPPRPWLLFKGWNLFPRDHRKITLVDEQMAFIGGVCIDENMRHWRDTHVQVNGPVVKEIVCSFNSVWDNAKCGKNHAKIPAKGKDVANHLVINEPTRGNHFLRDQILKKLSTAKHEILITTPYFVPAHSFTRLVFAALERGVKVSIITSGHANFMSYELGKLESGKFIRRGAKMYAYTACMLHAKTLVIDDHFVAVGSFNIDSLSFYHNKEADIVSTDPVVVDTLRGHFQNDLEHSHEMTMREWRQREWYQKIIGYICHPFRQYL